MAARDSLYLAIIAATTLILIMAANTSFADFPRLGALTAADGFLPRQLTYRGSRLVYSRGIVAAGAGRLRPDHRLPGQRHGLIPLYAIGVFLSFTLSQARHGAPLVEESDTWRPACKSRNEARRCSYEPGWPPRCHQRFGAVCTAVVAVVFAVTKFNDGAWVVILLIPTIGLHFLPHPPHYHSLARQLSLERLRAAHPRPTATG